MALSLYRKYRPQVFSDVVGQEHVEHTLVNAVGDGKQAAAGIDLYLGGDGILEKGFEQEITDNHIEGDIVPHCRFLTRQMDSKDAITGFMERNLGMHELDARAEASRCLRCDRR